MTLEKKRNTALLSPFDDNLHDIEMYLNVAFNSTGDPIFVKDEECRLLLVNDAFCQLIGVAKSDVIGKTLAEKVSQSEREHFLAIDRKVLEEGKEIVCEEKLTTSGEQTKTILTRKSRFIDSKGNYFIVGIVHDITERKQVELREKSRTDVLELITTGETLPAILQAIVHVVEQENPNMLCSVLLLDEAGKHLLNGAAPSLPHFYNEAIHGLEIGLGVGSCGTAAFTNERVIVENIQTHPYWQSFKTLAEKANLAACWSEPIHSTKGKVLGTFAIYHRQINSPTATDFTIIEQTVSMASIAIEKKQAEEKLELAASVFTHAGEGIMITDAQGTIVDVNKKFMAITQYSRAEAIGQNSRILQSERQSPEFYVNLWQALLKKGSWSGEIWNRRKDGEIYPEMLNISAVKDTAGQISNYVALFTDITVMKAHQGQLERIAHYDLLTGLPNRVLLADRLSQAMLQCNRHNKSLAVVFLDLDGFKHVNDTYGHDVGDELLVALSVRMKEALREGDSLARIGGDEFVAVLADLNDVADCEPVLERLLLSASDPVTVGNLVLNVSASIGVTLYPQDSVDADQLMRHADQAMYVAKESGKNRYHLFDTAHDDAVKIQQESLEAIRSALDNEQFILHYQPKIDMKAGTVIGVEALIRWQHPEKGLLNPIEFLPVIEHNPMSVEMGEWVIDTVLRQIKQWQKMGLNWPISTSVNIAAVQLQQPDFTQRLATLLSAHPDIDPSFLELEVLETSALDDIHHVSSIMNDCIALGVSFALDDFGTGYSSLTYLRRLPACLIKIDQSFVRDMLIDNDDFAIVEGVIALAKSFKREVIAEGVETIEHGTALLQLGCNLAQGYGIARPMPASDIPAWINNWQPDASWQR